MVVRSASFNMSTVTQVQLDIHRVAMTDRWCFATTANVFRHRVVGGLCPHCHSLHAHKEQTTMAYSAFHNYIKCQISIKICVHNTWVTTDFVVTKWQNTTKHSPTHGSTTTLMRMWVVAVYFSDAGHQSCSAHGLWWRTQVSLTSGRSMYNWLLITCLEMAVTWEQTKTLCQFIPHWMQTS